MLFIGHYASTAINVGKVAFTKKPMAINYPLCTKFGLCYMEWMLLFLTVVYICYNVYVLSNIFG